MKPNLAPRHMIPVVCYAILFVTSVFFLILVGTSDISVGEIPENAGLVGLLALTLVAAAMFVLVVVGVGSAVMTFFPLLFSLVNLSKRNRKLAIACLVFDALLVQFYLVGFFSALDAASLLIPFAAALGLSVLSLVMNILNVKRNKPIEVITEAEATEQNEITV